MSSTPENTRAVRRNLLKWFRAGARDLPWRRTRDPYAIWLSEILLQQTRVDQGLPYYQRFLSALPTLQVLAAATEHQVLKLWEGLGYYARARNLHKAARIIANERGGQFPQTVEEWQTLPGVGRYTAGAIASIAFGVRAPVLDGNVTRVLSRLFNVSQNVDLPKTRSRLWSLAESLVPKDSPGDFNQGLMELGARVCLPQRPACPECPVRRQCKARAAGVQDRRPVRTARVPTPHHEIAAAVIQRGGRLLLVKRPSRGLLGGLWEFPGCTLARNERREQALARGIQKDLGIEVQVGERIATVDHAYSHFRVTLHAYACQSPAKVVKPAAYAEAKWLTRRDLARYPLPKLLHKLLDALDSRSPDADT